MRIEWTEAAEFDLEYVEAYFGQYNVRSGAADGVRIEDQVKLLKSFPEMGRIGKLPGTREFVVPQSNCVVVYRLEDAVVRVLRIFHGGQEWPDAI